MNPANESTSPVTEFSSLPTEVKELIFAYSTPTLQEVSRTSKLNRKICNSSILRVKWLCTHYGTKNAVQAALAWCQILTPEILEILFELVPRVPRYVLQRAFTRFEYSSRPELMYQLLKYALKHYGPEGFVLNRPDTQIFRELVSSNFIASENTSNNRITKLTELMEKYHFDPNFCKSSETGIPTININDGYRIFLNAILAGSTVLVRELLKFGVDTHINFHPFPNLRFAGVPMSTLFTNRQIVISTVTGQTITIPYWALSYFPSELHEYLPSTCDALILAVSKGSNEMVTSLLEHDEERWSTETGLDVLKSALQLAVDDSFGFGITAIHTQLQYSKVRYELKNGKEETPPVEIPKRSAAALRRFLYDACTSNDLKTVKELVTEGARFELPGASSSNGTSNGTPTFFGRFDDVAFRHDPISHLILNNRYQILTFLIKNYPFGESALGDMLLKAIDSNSTYLARLILLKKGGNKPVITERTLKRTMQNDMSDIIPLLLRELIRREPTKLVRGFSSVLKMAARRMVGGVNSNNSVYGMLEAYERDITKRIASEKEMRKKRKFMPKWNDNDDEEDDAGRRWRNKGKGKARLSDISVRSMESVIEEEPEVQRKSRRKAAVAAAKAIEAVVDQEAESDEESGKKNSDVVCQKDDMFEFLGEDIDEDQEREIIYREETQSITGNWKMNGRKKYSGSSDYLLPFDYDSDEMREVYGLNYDDEEVEDYEELHGPGCTCCFSEDEVSEVESEYGWEIDWDEVNNTFLNDDDAPEVEETQGPVDIDSTNFPTITLSSSQNLPAPAASSSSSSSSLSSLSSSSSSSTGDQTAANEKRAADEMEETVQESSIEDVEMKFNSDANEEVILDETELLSVCRPKRQRTRYRYR
ncbi:hypothetical protein HK098_007231 [Nowakowskiella sp. JEL0407]|nr:hypothetical protein HK098_007231 [Nowakowskiella sp. JEL0407]